MNENASNQHTRRHAGKRKHHHEHRPPHKHLHRHHRTSHLGTTIDLIAEPAQVMEAELKRQAAEEAEQARLVVERKKAMLLEELITTEENLIKNLKFLQTLQFNLKTEFADKVTDEQLKVLNVDALCNAHNDHILPGLRTLYATFRENNGIGKLFIEQAPLLVFHKPFAEVCANNMSESLRWLQEPSVRQFVELHLKRNQLQNASNISAMFVKILRRPTDFLQFCQQLQKCMTVDDADYAQMRTAETKLLALVASMNATAGLMLQANEFSKVLENLNQADKEQLPSDILTKKIVKIGMVLCAEEGQQLPTDKPIQTKHLLHATLVLLESECLVIVEEADRQSTKLQARLLSYTLAVKARETKSTNEMLLFLTGSESGVSRINDTFCFLLTGNDCLIESKNWAQAIDSLVESSDAATKYRANMEIRKDSQIWGVPKAVFHGNSAVTRISPEEMKHNQEEATRIALQELAEYRLTHVATPQKKQKTNLKKTHITPTRAGYFKSPYGKYTMREDELPQRLQERIVNADINLP